MYYIVLDTFSNENSGPIDDRDEALGLARQLNGEVRVHRFVALALSDHQPSSYRSNPDHLSIPIRKATIVYKDWKTRVKQLLEEFNPRINWNLVKIRRLSRSIELSTPRSDPYSYRITLAKDSGFRGDLKKNSYYSYHITDSYLDDDNFEAMHAVFRLLFMGDEYLLPFLTQNGKTLTTPQQKAFDGFIESYDRGDRKGAIILPTGIGKTVVAAKVVVEKRPHRLLFVSHRNFILDQAIKTIKHEADERGWLVTNDQIGKFYGSYSRRELKREQWGRKYVFANPQSFNVVPREKWIDAGEFDLIIVDEFHHGNARTWFRVINHFNPDYLLGLTATPHRSDAEEPLRLVGDNVLYKAADWEREKGIRTLTLIEALKLGYLVLPDIKQLVEPEYKTISGENISPKALKNAEKDRARAIIEMYKSSARNKQAVAFCSGVSEAEQLEKAFTKAGIASTHVLGTAAHKKCCQDTPTQKRRSKKLKDFRDKKTQVLFVVDVLNEGVDIANVEAILWLRETVGVVKLLQQLGRGLRLDRGKRSLLVLDFMDNIRRVQDYIKEGFTATGGPIYKAKRKKKLEDRAEENEIIELLDSQGLITIGKDISLVPMDDLTELSGDELAPYIPSEPEPETTRVTASKPRKLPQPTPSNLVSMSRTIDRMKKIKNKIVSYYDLPREERPYVPEMATKLGIDSYNIMEILYEEGLSTREPIFHPSNIELSYSEEGQNQILRQLDKPEKVRIRKILRPGVRVFGKRTFGKRDECRLSSCNRTGNHRGLCELHYLFTYREIFEGRAFEEDLIARFLLEPKVPFLKSRKLRRRRY